MISVEWSLRNLLDFSSVNYTRALPAIGGERAVSLQIRYVRVYVVIMLFPDTEERDRAAN